MSRFEGAGADIVIVGAGTAGCILASRLSEDPSRRVLLVEAGGRDWNPLLRVPLMNGVLYRMRLHNWFFSTEPEPALNGRSIFWPRGKVLGGSSSINGGVYTRGLASDYDHWAQTGLTDWSHERILPYFRRSERYGGGADAVHGGEGPLPISRGTDDHVLFDAFIAAGRQAGFPATQDFNGPSPEGFGRYDMTVQAGERWSAARAFLDPARARPNLRIVTGAHLIGVAIERGRATGVRLLRGRTEETLTAGEVVLSCGAVNSPTALMRSGIGDPALLERLGIKVVADLPEVGRNLQDHLLVRVQHACTQPITMHHTMRMDRAALALLQAMLAGRGPAAAFPLQAGAFLRSDPDVQEPDLQSHFLPGLSTAGLRLPFRGNNGPGGGHGYFANVYQLRPRSRGSITLRSADPLAAPVIRANYLSDPYDRMVLRRGIRLLREVFAQPAFAPFRGPELAPGADVQSDAALDAYIAATASTVFHPVGTCRMGVDENAVLDGQLRVRGVAGLRVVDASAIPTMPSANTNAPTMMIAERAADFIRGQEAASS